MGRRAISGRAKFFVFEFPNPLNFTMVASLVLSAVVFALVLILALFGTPGKKVAASPVSEPGVRFTGGMDQGGCVKEGRGLACE